MMLRNATLGVVWGWMALCAQAQDRVVYHVNDAATQAPLALRYIGNQLDHDPATQVTLVAHGAGVDFLMEGAKDRQGVAYASAVAALKARGVHFEACQVTMKNRNLRPDQFLLEAEYTPAGAVRLTKLQMQGWAYIKP
jgi:uncharacterized protein